MPKTPKNVQYFPLFFFAATSLLACIIFFELVVHFKIFPLGENFQPIYLGVKPFLSSICTFSTLNPNSHRIDFSIGSKLTLISYSSKIIETLNPKINRPLLGGDENPSVEEHWVIPSFLREEGMTYLMKVLIGNLFLTLKILPT